MKNTATEWFGGRELEAVRKIFWREFGLMPGLVDGVTAYRTGINSAAVAFG